MTNFVLVGGTFLGAWAWEKVTPLLELQGHRVVPLTLTGLGDRVHLASAEIDAHTHARDIVNAIGYADLWDVVLVAHSYAGVPATMAANLIPERIARIVYVGAALPVAGRTLHETLPPEVAGVFATITDGWRMKVFTQDFFDTYWPAHGMTPEQLQWLWDRSTEHPMGTYNTPAPDDLAAATALPRLYIWCANDPKPPVSGMPLLQLDSGHWPMISEPAALARILDEAAAG
ncbi:alpha/beta hydrolase [Pseudonocardiaceae bacterium YIM PH 21723]|nr:alpha/beta hydrolase [Pseudonocardiaceae bacterium YIM PH 21723]